jgi:transcriptional regulator with XRE-family HTH domain
MPARGFSARKQATDSNNATKSQPRKTAGVPGDDVGAAALGRRVAESLHKLRKERRLSLDDLSAASGVSRAALSQIEGCRTNPTLTILWKVAVGLEVPFHVLLGAGQAGRPQVLRASDAAPLRTPDGRMESRLLSPAGATQGIDVYELRFLAKGIHRSEPHGEGTSEVLILLTGSLRVTVGDDSYDLAPGDSMFFHADVPHTYENRSSHDARCIDVIVYG